MDILWMMLQMVRHSVTGNRMKDKVSIEVFGVFRENFCWCRWGGSGTRVALCWYMLGLEVFPPYMIESAGGGLKRRFYYCKATNKAALIHIA